MISALRSGAWVSPERLKKYPVLFLALYILIGAAWIFSSNGYLDPTGKPLGTDFLNQYAASKLILAGDAELAYDYTRHGQVENEIMGAEGFGYYGWHYPPVALLLVAPFALVSYGAALVLWMAFTLVMYLGVLRKILDVPGVVIAALAYPAVLINIGHGHNGFLSCALLGGALYLLGSGRQVFAGVLLGLLIYKPQFGVLIPIALLAGAYWRAFATAAVTACLFILVSWIAFGSEAWTAFQASTEITRSYILEQGATGWHKIQSCFSLVRGLGGDIELAYFIQGSAMLVGALAIA